MQIAPTNGMMMPSVNNSNSALPTYSNTSIAGLLHQNSMNSRHQNPLTNTTNGPYQIQIQIPSPGSSSTQPQPQPFQSPTPSLSNNQTSHNNALGPHLNSATSPNISMSDAAADANDSQSSVQKIIQEMMMSSQLGGASMGIDMKNSNDLIQSGGNNSSGVVVNGGGQTGIMMNGMRGAMGHNNSVNMNGRVAMQMMNQPHHQQQDLGSQLLNGLGAGAGAVNGFNNLPFDWKPSP